MNDKKHIDRLFQERFKDFEATPSDAVWENIEAQLNKKKKKHRIIPIWWRYAGVAALLLLLLTVGGIYFNGPVEIDPVHNVVESEETKTPEKQEESKLLDDPITSENVLTNNNNDASNAENQQSSQDQASEEITPSEETSIAENSSSETENRNQNVKNPGLNKTLTLSKQLPENKDQNAVAVNPKKTSNQKDQLNNNTKNNTVASIDIPKKNERDKNESLLIEKDKANQIINDASKNNTAIAQNTDELPVTDTNSPSIEDAIKRNEENDEEEKEKSNRWSIAPNAAPVYFSSLGNDGSSIDPQFNNNSKSSELNMSYGIKASYAINDKLSIRSGINRVNLGYNTNNVVMFESVSLGSNSLSLQNVNPNVEVGSVNDTPVESVSLISADNIVSAKTPELFSTKSNISLNQSLGYIEIPLEIQYAISNKKLGVNVIGGFSSFFLSNNEIFSEAEGSKTFIGEATNLNKVSYSANFGLGLNYKFSKRIDLNLEPIFKYQINTFNSTSGDFKPYFIGVYTGFAIKF